MGTNNVAFTGVAPANLGVNTRNEDISQDVDLVTARINYRFGYAASRYWHDPEKCEAVFPERSCSNKAKAR